MTVARAIVDDKTVTARSHGRSGRPSFQTRTSAVLGVSRMKKKTTKKTAKTAKKSLKKKTAKRSTKKKVSKK
jgi:hypothetical protein